MNSFDSIPVPSMDSVVAGGTTDFQAGGSGVIVSGVDGAEAAGTSAHNVLVSNSLASEMQLEA